MELKLISPGNSPIKPRKYPKTTAGLTRKIVDFLNENGAFATRVSSMGTYRADKHRFVFSQQVKGMPDIQGIYKGRGLYIEIKTGSDRMSPQQISIMQALTAHGARYFIAHDFESFVVWFNNIKDESN